jgi:hypothetical protein
MTRWTRMRIVHICGQCNATIPAGEPVHLMTITGVRRAFVRCERCDGPAPELAPLPVREPATSLPFARFSPEMLPLDWKQKASGEA